MNLAVRPKVRLLSRLFCLFGFHAWEADLTVDKYWDIKRCRHCPVRREPG